MSLMPSPSIWNGSGGSGSDPALDSRVVILEDKYVRTSRFAQISSGASGAVTLPPNSIVVLDDFGGTVDAVISNVAGGRPDFTHAYTGTTLVTTSFDSSGNYVLSSTPDVFPVSIIYRVRQKLKDFDSTSADIVGDPDYGDYVLKAGDTMTGQLVLPSLKLKNDVHELATYWDGVNNWFSFGSADSVSFNSLGNIGLNGSTVGLTSTVLQVTTGSGSVGFTGDFYLKNESYNVIVAHMMGSGELIFSSANGQSMTFNSELDFFLTSTTSGNLWSGVNIVPNLDDSFSLGGTSNLWAGIYVGQIKDSSVIAVDIKNRKLNDTSGNEAVNFSTSTNVSFPGDISVLSGAINTDRVLAGSVQLQGMSGNGIIQFPSQTVVASPPTSSAIRQYSDNLNRIAFVDDSNRSFTLSLNSISFGTVAELGVPNASGNIALIQSILASSATHAPSGSAVQTAIAGKASIINPTFLGMVTLVAGTTSIAPLKFVSGTNLTTPVDGSVEYDGSDLTVTTSGTRKFLDKVLRASATLDFPSTLAGTSSDLTITVTGAALGDVVGLGVPHASTSANGSFSSWVSATNTVTVRFSNNSLTLALDPASGSFKVSVSK